MTLEWRPIHCFGRPCSKACLDQSVNLPDVGLKMDIYGKRRIALLQQQHHNYLARPTFCMITRRCGSVYLGVVVLRVRYFEHALLQLKNCHHILPEKTNPLLHLFAEPHSLNSMSQSTTKTVSFHDNVWKYAHLQCRHAWSQIATYDISGYSPENGISGVWVDTN